MTLYIMKWLIKVLTVAKNSFITAVLFLGSYFVPIAPLIVVSAVLSLLDWFIKIYTIVITEGKAAVQSSKMESTFFKILVYAAFIMCLHVVDLMLFKTALKEVLSLVLEENTVIAIMKISFATVGCLMISMRELKSIDENWILAFGYSPFKFLKSMFGQLFKWKS